MMNQLSYWRHQCPSTADNVKTSEHIRVCILCLPGLPRMVVIRDYGGIPSPHCGPPLSIHAGDVIELMFADLHSSWWQVRVTQLLLVLSQHLWLWKNNMSWLTGLVQCTRCLRSVISLNGRCMSSQHSLVLIDPQSDTHTPIHPPPHRHKKYI